MNGPVGASNNTNGLAASCDDIADRSPSQSTDKNYAFTKSLHGLPSECRAMTATFNTTELLEHILNHLAPLQLLRAKAVCRNFRNTIGSSPALRRQMNTYIRLGAIDGSILSKSDAGGDIAYPVDTIEPLAFFYPSDAERRLFVRFSVDQKRFRQLQQSSSFRRLIVVDQPLTDINVGWHCGCFADPRSEAKLDVEHGKATFGDLFLAMERKHKSEGCEPCSSMIKFWLDGSWSESREMREFC